ncbi:sulfite reductase (NADPH) hemoprotein beta-component [Allopseudospirillum japonicum]|uniref:Sulfite reductase (NADPH) hemoprotein beta-component n=1 Tax=Allopseudospirillum japonicum TaxID=64971 RepID=A0A1H6S9E3_9GAMM|nr:nitrite/sulfite reductase [Allopseudospirillum japonicum]SEI64643.1 sulfite reductase (NADPH) hemoprotein beta-component [Allopseudospirillum japonicum]
MYQYDTYDQTLVNERVAQFKDQTQRYLAGDLSEDEYRPLRLQNGVYIQRHAPMLRVAIPYGMLSARQLRTLAHIATTYDKGYAHFTTRQNVQFNWIPLEKIPQVLDELAQVEMHAIQTSGNCIRNTTTDQFAGIAADEVADPRPWCELIRQWSTLHPEFAFLPRKFKIAVNGAKQDRAAVQVHDIGLELVQGAQGLAFKVWVGGGLGRTPLIADVICEALPWQHLITYLEAILRVYNQYGRRDNKYKARIKILVKALGVDTFRARVEQEWQELKDGPSTLTEQAVTYAARFFHEPARTQGVDTQAFEQARAQNKAFSRFVTNNVQAHKVSGYAAVTLSLKHPSHAPGDINTQQMTLVADLAESYSLGELRVSHNQNLVLADVRLDQLFELWQILDQHQLASPTVGTLQDIICCPGGDFCNLANAKSIPIAQAIQAKIDDLDYVYDLGPLDLNISGCMNACGHHHIGHIGILGVDKKGQEFYQISLGGRSGNQANIGKILGPSFAQEAIPEVIAKLLAVYVAQRHPEETFVDTYHRIGAKPFKEGVYA